MRAKRLAGLVVGCFVTLGSAAGCTRPSALTARRETVTTGVTFDDFTTARVDSVAQLRQMAAMPPGDELGKEMFGTKFVIANFSEPDQRSLHFLDGRYYRYHDEWAWFRLLNGQAVPGLDELEPHPVRTPDEARRWALADPDALPDGLNVVEERLYHEEFYDRALSPSERVFGAGSLVYIPARANAYPEQWGFELEYNDHGSVEDVLVFFQLLEAALPPEVASCMRWITRSPSQAEVAQRLIARLPRFAGRVMSYDDISVPGETVVYNSGIVAGRLQAFRSLEALATANPDNILVLGALPEYLPQARGVLTAIPQTPLSHLNLLAASRGIVNAYRGGVLDDPEISNLVRSGAPVVVLAENGKLRFQRIDELQYARWQELRRPPPPPPRSVSLERAPYVIDLSRVDLATLDAVSPLIGGKSVGMVHLLHALRVASSKEQADGATTTTTPFDVPDRPLAITVRAYREHLAPLLPEIKALLSDANFRKNRKLRYLALEGLEKFESRFASKRDREAARTYAAPRATGAIAAIVRRGGLQHLIRKTPIPKTVEAELERVQQHFSNYAEDQGLRFRSSSTVEDVEGSSGAGLYESFTGYAKSKTGGPANGKRPSLADALRKTWASYYGVEAFEERHESGMDHLAADMGVLVHARFDDALEDSNGVFTFTLTPEGGQLLVDAQPGAISVTNPPTNRVVRPESSQVTTAGGSFQTRRLNWSSEVAHGALVLSEQELADLYTFACRLTEAQLQRTNAVLSPAQRRRSLVLDFEFRRVKAGWPALQSGAHPARFVVKQMRPLEPNPALTEALRKSPIPRDVLARTRRVERRRCVAGSHTVDALLVYTDANILPELGYSVQPLLASLTVANARHARVFTHLDQKRTVVSPTSLIVEFEDAVEYSRLSIDGDRLELLRRDLSPTLAPPPMRNLPTERPAPGGASTASLRCETNVEFAAPTELLRGFLQPSPPVRP